MRPSKAEPAAPTRGIRSLQDIQSDGKDRWDISLTNFCVIAYSQD
jgi:hypothetical protein